MSFSICSGVSVEMYESSLFSFMMQAPFKHGERMFEKNNSENIIQS